jgi:hypothetical protein
VSANKKSHLCKLTHTHLHKDTHTHTCKHIRPLTRMHTHTLATHTQDTQTHMLDEELGQSVGLSHTLLQLPQKIATTHRAEGQKPVHTLLHTQAEGKRHRHTHTQLPQRVQTSKNTFIILSCIPFCPQNSLNSSGHGVYKVSKAFHRDARPC